jgi:enoyl-CoA hydratase/carnithine racemase
MTDTGDNLLIERDGPVATITLNRPKLRNSMTNDMKLRIEELFAEWDSDAEVRAVILTGAGTAFCSGGDLSAVNLDSPETPLQAQRRLRRSSHLAEVIAESRLPVIAAVNGAAVGAGCNLALICDLILASDKARFGQMYLQRGLGMDWGGSWSLPRLIGLHRAKEFVFSPELVDAERAAAMGLVNRVTPAEQLMDEARNLAHSIATNAPVALNLAKKALNRSEHMTLADALDREAYDQGFLFSTSDSMEGIKAFMEKRPPRFRGE